MRPPRFANSGATTIDVSRIEAWYIEESTSLMGTSRGLVIVLHSGHVIRVNDADGVTGIMQAITNAWAALDRAPGHVDAG